MTPQEQALIDAYEAERKAKREKGDARSPAFAAGWFLKRYGNGREALRAWLNTGARIAYPTDKGKAWAGDVAELLRACARGEAS